MNKQTQRDGTAFARAARGDKLREECGVFGVSLNDATDYAEAAGSRTTHSSLCSTEGRKAPASPFAAAMRSPAGRAWASSTTCFPRKA